MTRGFEDRHAAVTLRHYQAEKQPFWAAPSAFGLYFVQRPKKLPPHACFIAHYRTATAGMDKDSLLLLLFQIGRLFNVSSQSYYPDVITSSAWRYEPLSKPKSPKSSTPQLVPFDS